MNLTLRRQNVRSDGVFGELIDDTGQRVAVTLEHAFSIKGEYEAAVPAGVYQCLKSMHFLKNAPRALQTFEVLNVPGHTGILFHVGNWNEDSDGCILLGDAVTGDPTGMMIIDSKRAFTRFMAVQDGVAQFTLTVVDA